MKKFMIIFGLLFLFFFFYFAIISASLKQESVYPINKDTLDYFGNGRFQISLLDFIEPEKNDLLTLWDEDYYFQNNQISTVLINDIEKYIEKKPYLYLIGYYLRDSAQPQAQYLPYFGYNPETKQEIKFERLDEIPRYTILNYESGEIEFYNNFDEIPEKDQKIFNKKAWFGCEFFLWRRCYQTE